MIREIAVCISKRYFGLVQDTELEKPCQFKRIGAWTKGPAAPFMLNGHVNKDGSVEFGSHMLAIRGRWAQIIAVKCDNRWSNWFMSESDRQYYLDLREQILRRDRFAKRFGLN